MTKIIVVGAAGRMGRRLVSLAMDSAGKYLLTGATEISGSPFLEQDAGLVAGSGTSGVKISPELAPLLANAEVVIDFSTGNPLANAELAVSAGLGIVIGGTAIEKAQKAAIAELARRGGRIVMSSNMSVGLNLVAGLCAETAGILGDSYDIEIVEMHHSKKKDSPSGSAILLAEAVAAARGCDLDEKAVYGRSGLPGERPRGEIGIHAVRGGDVVGDHTVIFATEGERIEIVHKASSRDAFAKGALRAAEFLRTSKPGLYDMRDVLGLSKGRPAA